tara:strand:- start:181 stop:1374 length:1194 start_codon:yes stop_codon:yes gene_type:complete
MKITDLKCAIIGNNPVIRITTDEEIEGIAAGEANKSYLKPMILFYKDLIVGKDPTDVERVMLGIRRLGAFKPWGAAVSMIEMALWDIAGKAAGVPVYKLLGGKIRDRVRVYNGSIRFPLEGNQPEHYAHAMQKMKALPERFSIIKQAVAFHDSMYSEIESFYYGTPVTEGRYPNRGMLTQKGFNHLVKCIEAMVDVLDDEVGLALDCGPGMTVVDALKLAKAVEGMNVTWLEDMITGDYTPYVLSDLYLQVTPHTSTAIHTGEQIYLRQNFVELIEQKAVNIIGPDPADVGGISEMKFIAEYADLHGILFAPHGTGDGLLGLAALVQLAATLPDNYIAFELPSGDTEWWYEILNGIEHLVVEDSHIVVPDLPGIGITFKKQEAIRYLRDDDRGFFDN